MMFKDRMGAGEKLAQKIESENIKPDVVIVVSKRGIPVGDYVSRRLNVPIDMVLAGKVSAPGEPEIPMGAVSNDRTIWLKDQLIDELMVTEEYLSQEIDKELGRVRERLEKYRGKTGRPRLKGKKVVVVDDGVSSGLKMSACIGQVIKAAPEEVTLATPVISSYAQDKLEPLVDKSVFLERVRFLDSVDSYYGILRSQEELQVQDRFVSDASMT